MPKVVAEEEKRMNALRSWVSSCRLSAPSTLGRSTVPTCSGVRASSTPSSSTPAVCTTADTGWSASSAARASRSAASHAATVTVAPRASSSVTRSAAPGASGPRREVSSRPRTPYLTTRCLANTAPRPPVPPVMSTVPSSTGTSARTSELRASRATRTTPSRRLICGSPVARAAGKTSSEAAEPSVSSRRNRSGCSVCAERTKPWTALPAWSAPVVAKTRRDSAKRSSASHAHNRRSAVRTASCTSAAPPVPAGMLTSTASAGSMVERSASRTVSTIRMDAPATGRTVQSTWNRDSVKPAASWSARTSRSTSDPTEATGAPVVSASWSETPSAPVGERRTRTAVAPTACRATSRQANGSLARPPDSTAPIACSVASSSAGWMPNPVTSPSTTTSANTSSPRRHTALAPWNTGP